MQDLSVGAYQFSYICNIVPDQEGGNVKPLLPQSLYENVAGLRFHQYGAGPFCHFTVPRVSKAGVYLIRVNGEFKYVGECEHLSPRFNMGYGNISPRNCFVGGQPTNCRINHNIYEMAQVGCEIQLFFCETYNRFEVERKLISQLSPEWNRSKGKTVCPIK